MLRSTNFWKFFEGYNLMRLPDKKTEVTNIHFIGLGNRQELITLGVEQFLEA